MWGLLDASRRFPEKQRWAKNGNRKCQNDSLLTFSNSPNIGECPDGQAPLNQRSMALDRMVANSRNGESQPNGQPTADRHLEDGDLLLPLMEASTSLADVRLDFLDCYRSRRRLLDHLSSDGFDHWSDRAFHFPRSFLHWGAFGLGLGNRSLRCLGHLACFRAFR